MDAETTGLVVSYGPIVFMVVLFYFLLYKPQKKEQKRRIGMLETLKKGNRVLTLGGIYGEITAIHENVIKLKIAENVEIQVARASISANVSQDETDAK
ncbi:MAG: preprotein translocase subunit YajC [Selenomonadaceae bacterium]|jgi:preprotein translocase, YajC subunit